MVSGGVAASAAEWTCGDSVATSELEVTSKLLAKATAVAASFIYEQCDDGDGAYTCAFAGTEIQHAAQAVAACYAQFWADAITCTATCNVSVDAVSEAVGSILAEAAADAYAAACVGACS